MDSKQEIIGNIYYNESGFGSKATTLKHAREKDKSISVKDAEEFFKQNVEIKKKNQGATTPLLHLTITILIKLIYSLFQKRT